MALFRRDARALDTHPVTDFWSWWAGEGQHLSPHEESVATDELTRRVAAIHPDLTWHFGPGVSAEHRLTVSASGLAEARPAAERWVRAAPGGGQTWEFRSSQEADPDALANVLSIAGETVELEHTVFRAEVAEDVLRVHVGVFHPSFPAMPDVVRRQITYLVLDWLLGEDNVERWVGHVEALEGPSPESVSGAEVIAAVSSVARVADPEEWALFEWRDKEGAPGLATFRRGLRWLDSPTFDRHHAVTAAFRAHTSGLPADVEGLETLRAHEDSLIDLLGTRGLLVGHETSRGVRTFHVYTDGEDANASELVRSWVKGRGLKQKVRADPGWTHVRQFTG